MTTMERLAARLAIGGVVVAACGCGPRYATMSSHTLTVAEHQEKDVIWIVEEGRGIMRCENQTSGPVCVPVRTP